MTLIANDAPIPQTPATAGSMLIVEDDKPFQQRLARHGEPRLQRDHRAVGAEGLARIDHRSSLDFAVTDMRLGDATASRSWRR